MGLKTLCILALVALFGWGVMEFGDLFWFAIHPAAPETTSERTIIIQVARGHLPGSLTQELAAQGIITDPHEMLRLGQILRKWKKMKAGEYLVSNRMTPIQIFSLLQSGVSLSFPVTVHEGENIYQIANSLASKQLTERERFLTICKDQSFIQSLGFQKGSVPSLEGYLFPETYNFNRTVSVEDMAKIMLQRFLKEWDATKDSRAAALRMTRHEIITLASIIEKETGAPEERPLISSVFHNRLKKRMRLESDPTTIYGIWERYKGNIRRSDLQEKNNYNTYAISGLPIGPIGNPGKEAIEAALYPTESEFLFFVSKNDGTHEFTRSFKEHAAAVRKFQLNSKAREGKSWRDLKNRSSP